MFAVKLYMFTNFLGYRIRNHISIKVNGMLEKKLVGYDVSRSADEIE